MSRVLAVTASMGTKWESYSQALLAQHVPHWRRIVVDGRKNWTPIGFIEHVIDADVDYVVHVDEDCFIRAREPLLALIEAMERDDGLVAAGIPDGGHYYRQHNPAALNLFFVVFRMDALRKAWAGRNGWAALRFQPAFADEVTRQWPALDPARISWDDMAEPYYPLFWSLLSSGGRFLYLGEQLDRTRWSTRVMSQSGEVIAEHLWYLRQWFSQTVMPGHDLPNAQRFEQFEAELMARPESGLRLRCALACGHARRLMRRLKQ